MRVKVGSMWQARETLGQRHHYLGQFYPLHAHTKTKAYEYDSLAMRGIFYSLRLGHVGVGLHPTFHRTRQLHRTLRRRSTRLLVPTFPSTSHDQIWIRVRRWKRMSQGRCEVRLTGCYCIALYPHRWVVAASCARIWGLIWMSWQGRVRRNGEL
jgi:hypothetical protein